MGEEYEFNNERFVYEYPEEKREGGYDIIPHYVVADERLSASEKLLYARILSLKSKYNFCFASNAYLAKAFNVNKRTISKRVNHLKECGYIDIAMIHNPGRKDIKQRRIYVKGNPNSYSRLPQDPLAPNHKGPLLEDTRGPSEKTQGALVENHKENNKRLITKNNIKVKSTSPSPSFVGEVVEKWNSLDSNIPRLKSLKAGTSRYSNLKARVNEYGEKAVLEAIENINHSRFLQGYVKARTVNFDWFVRPNNFLKVYEGNYNDEDFKQEQKEAELNREPTDEEIDEALRSRGIDGLEAIGK